VLLFAVAWALKGAARALDSGPLEAWYVDTVHARQPAGDITRGLSWAAAADGGGLAVGATLGGILPLLVDRSGAAALAVPLFLAAVLAGISVIAVLLLVVPVRRSRASGAAALRAEVRRIPALITATAQLVRSDRPLRLLLLTSALVGLVLTSLELLGPLHVADLAGSPELGSAAFGVITAVSFGAAAVGSLMAPALDRAVDGSVARAGAITSVLAALAVGAVALAPGVAVAAVAFCAFYLLNAAAWPLRKRLMHGRTDSAHRATTISASSLALMLGGIVGNLTLPRLADAAGLSAGLLAGAVGMLLVAVVSLGLRVRAAAGAAVQPG
jgi:hypothetical protein